ncbi:AI-2E family transporter YdiK [Franconibacter pulveris]
MSLVLPKYDLPRIIFGCLAVLCMLAASLWLLHPFLISLVWAGLVVIATWPVMLRIQAWLGRRRSLAVLVMSLLLVALFVIPLLFMASSLMDISARLSQWLDSDKLPLLISGDFLHSVPFIGARLYARWQAVVADRGHTLITQLQPWLRHAALVLLTQLGHLGQLIINGIIMLALSALLYMNGEKAAGAMSRFARRLAGQRGDIAVTLAGQTIRAVASGIVVTAVCQSVLGGVGLALCGIPGALLFTVVIFILCLAQLGPIIIMLPATAWLYWQGEAGWATLLLVWSLAVGSMDNILRPLLIRRGADVPMMLILGGVIGGLLTFGIVGLFIGPAVLAVSWRLLVIWVNELETPVHAAED